MLRALASHFLASHLGRRLPDWHRCTLPSFYERLSVWLDDGVLRCQQGRDRVLCAPIPALGDAHGVRRPTHQRPWAAEGTSYPDTTPNIVAKIRELFSTFPR